MTAAATTRRRLERQLRASLVKIVLLDPECEVCGRRMDKQFLRRWNERNVCKPCIAELTAEVDAVDDGSSRMDSKRSITRRIR